MTAPALDKVTALLVHFDEQCWPRRVGDSVDVDEIEHRLRHGDPTRADLLFAASVMRAYTELTRAEPKKFIRTSEALEAACRAGANP